MTRLACIAALLLLIAAPACAQFGLGAGLDIGTDGVFDGVTVATFQLADIDAWTLGPLQFTASEAVAVATTRDFTSAYLGIGLQRGIAILSAGYSTDTSWGARLTLLGVRF